MADGFDLSRELQEHLEEAATLAKQKRLLEESIEKMEESLENLTHKRIDKEKRINSIRAERKAQREYLLQEIEKMKQQIDFETREEQRETQTEAKLIKEIKNVVSRRQAEISQPVCPTCRKLILPNSTLTKEAPIEAIEPKQPWNCFGWSFC